MDYQGESLTSREAAERVVARQSLPLLLLVVSLAAAIMGQGAYYAPVQVVVAVGLTAAAVASARVATWSKDDLRLPPVRACAALAVWALMSAAVSGDPLRATGCVALLGGAVAVVLICRRADVIQRKALLDAVLVLCSVAAFSGWAGVAWRVPPWGLDLAHQGLWRAATTLTYANASAALLAAAALLVLARLASRPRSPVTALVACLLLTGTGATLSRGGLVAFAVGAAVLGCLVGPRRLLRAAAPPVLGAAVALAGLAPSIPADSEPRPALAVVALAAGLTTAVALTRLSPRKLAAAAVGVAAAAALAAGGFPSGAVDRVADARLHPMDTARSQTAEAALRLAGEHPIAGVGPGQAALTWTGPNGEALVYRYAHDEYLQTLVELGGIGLALVLALMWAVAVALRRAASYARPRETWAGIVAALVAMAVHSGFDFLWHVPALVLVGALLVGVVSPGVAKPAAPPAPGEGPQEVYPARGGGLT